MMDPEDLRKVAFRARLTLEDPKTPIYFYPSKEDLAMDVREPRYWRDIDTEHDDAIFATDSDFPVCATFFPCQGCGEHRYMTDQEFHNLPLIESQYCFRCLARLESEARAEKGLLC